MRRLVDLEPEWVRRTGRVVGVRFTCPIDDGPGPHREGHQVAVLFANPPDGGPPHPDDPDCVGNNSGQRWTRSGATFETLSISPSIDCTAADRHCWHGFVSAGEVTC